MALGKNITRLDGVRVIVTGGASGMGEGLVRAFPQLGAHVVSLDLTEESGSAIAAAAGATFVRADVADKDSVDAAFDRAVESLGGLDVLIHAAGIAPKAYAEETSVDLWNQTMAVNALGTLLTNQAAFRHMKSAGGRILNFASSVGMVGMVSKPAYAASKGAVLAFTRTVALEWAPYGITVNAIAPAIYTPMYAKTRSLKTPEELAIHDAAMATAVPLGGKLGDVEKDFVPVLAFYASEGASFVTGQTIAVDGGMVAVR